MFHKAQETYYMQRRSKTVFPEIARPAGRAFLFLFWLIPVFDRNQWRVSRSAERDQVPPGRASLRGWIAPGRRPGPACRRRAGFRFRDLTPDHSVNVGQSPDPIPGTE